MCIEKPLTSNRALERDNTQSSPFFQPSLSCVVPDWRGSVPLKASAVRTSAASRAAYITKSDFSDMWVCSPRLPKSAALAQVTVLQCSTDCSLLFYYATYVTQANINSKKKNACKDFNIKYYTVLSGIIISFNLFHVLVFHLIVYNFIRIRQHLQVAVFVVLCRFFFNRWKRIKL